MQKLFASILLLLYSTANFGVSLRLDFCGETLHDVAFFSSEKNTSDCCLIMGMDEDCCDSKQVILQDYSDKIQKSLKENTTIFHTAIPNQEENIPILVSVLNGQEMAIKKDFSPPKLRRHLLISCFLI